MAVSPENVLATLSALLWAVLRIVSVKHVWIVLKYDNDGEGGVLALTALAHRDAPCWWSALGCLPPPSFTATRSSRPPSRCCPP
jgi:K+ transporter